jgi:hypothetical protein
MQHAMTHQGGSQLRSIRLPNGMTVVPGDWTSSVPLYSTVEVAAGAIPDLRAFNYTEGMAVPGSIGQRTATELDTNLQGEGGKLPENEELIVHTISCEVFKRGTAADASLFPDPDQPEVPLPDMLRLQRDLLVALVISTTEKEYSHSPLSFWPASTGVRYARSGSLTRVSDGATGTVVANNGGVGATMARSFASPNYVAGGEPFHVAFRANRGEITNLNLARAGAEAPLVEGRMVIRCFLGGYRRRPVA